MQPGADGLDFLAALLRRPSWQADALCREFPEINFFPERGEDLRPAKSVCRRCSVRPECEAFATEGHDVGIWGGTSAIERRVKRSTKGRDAA